MKSLFGGLSKSVGLHLMLGVLLVASVDFSPEEQPELPEVAVPIIEATVVDQNTLDEQVKKIQQEKEAVKRAEERRVRELEKRAADAAKKRRQNEQKIQELEKQKQRKLNEKKKADQAAALAKKKQKEEKQRADQAEKERKRKEQERKKAEEEAERAKEKREKEKKAAEEAEKKRKEAERKRKEAAEKAEQERILDEQLRAEQAARQQRRNKQVLSEVDKYKALINDAIYRNLIVDQSMRGKECRLNIRLASNGLVTKVTILSGDSNVCRAAQTAVLRSDTLPVSREPDVYQQLKDINITVRPENV